MKPAELKLPSGEYLIVPILKAEREFFINNIGCLKATKTEGKYNSCGPVMATIDMYLQDFEIIAELSCIPEEKAKTIVEEIKPGIYKNYLRDTFFCEKAYESLKTLFCRERLFIKNILGEKPQRMVAFKSPGRYTQNDEMRLAEHREELKVWDEMNQLVQEDFLILKKNK